MITVTSLILLLSGIAAGSLAYANTHNKHNNIKTLNNKNLKNDVETYSKSLPAFGGDRDYYLNINSEHIHDLYNLLWTRPSTYFDEGQGVYDFLINNSSTYWEYGDLFHHNLISKEDDGSLLLMLEQRNRYIENGGFDISALLADLDQMENVGPWLSISWQLHVDYKPLGHNLYSMSFACHS